RPIATRKEEKADRTDRRCAQMAVESCVANPGADGACKALCRQLRGSSHWRTPPHQRADGYKIARRIDPKGRCDSKTRRDNPAEGRPERSTDVNADAIHGERRAQVF